MPGGSVVRVSGERRQRVKGRRAWQGVEEENRVMFT